MSKHLFLGGPLDGRTVEVAHVELHNPFTVCQLAAPEYDFPLTAEVTLPSPEDVSGYERFDYWPHRLWFENEQETVYTTSRDGGINIIRALIAGYHKPEDYPDRAVELGRTYERQFFIDWCRRYLGYVPSRLKAYLVASLLRANQALQELREK